MDFKLCEFELILFSSCKLIDGVKRSLILDLDRHKYHLIPNDLYEIIKDNSRIKINKIYEDFGLENHLILDEYFNFLHKNELINLTNIPNQFPDISLDFEIPSLIDNIILDISDKPSVYTHDLINNLILLGCRNFQLRFFSLTDYNDVLIILEYFDFSTVRNIELVLPYSIKAHTERLKFLRIFPRITNIIFHSSPFVKLEKFKSNDVIAIVYTPQNISSQIHCGVVSHDFFAFSTVFFNESQSFNTCLNRKLSIDTEGNIKNCPSMEKSFGNINDPELNFEAIVDSEEFQKVWHIGKDKIHVCKDCEFRHVCTDCRAYVEDPSDILSKPLKCGYNPYTCEWEEWSTHPMKQKAIDYYQMRDII